MHTDIMQWSSDLLYEGKLTADRSVADHLLNNLRPNIEDNENTSKSNEFFLELSYVQKNQCEIFINIFLKIILCC